MNQVRYSPDFWPRATLPVPLVRRFSGLTLQDDGWITAVAYDAPESGPCPPEMHLREFADADIRDDASLLHLVRTVGLPLDEFAPWRGVVGRNLFPKLQESYYRRSLEAMARRLHRPAPDLAQRPDGRGVHVVEVALRVREMNLLVATVAEALAEGGHVEQPWQASGLFDVLEEDPRVLSREEGLAPAEAAWEAFAESLNDGLAAVSARVIPRGAPEDSTDAYTAGCILVFNDLVDGMPYRRCADETCGRLFRHQLGRAEVGAYSRSDARFCSPQHARNQSQRERRRLARAANREGAN